MTLSQFATVIVAPKSNSSAEQSEKRHAHAMTQSIYMRRCGTADTRQLHTVLCETVWSNRTELRTETVPEPTASKMAPCINMHGTGSGHGCAAGIDMAPHAERA